MGGRRRRAPTIAARLLTAMVAVGMLVAPPPTEAADAAVAGGRFVTTWTGTSATLCLFGDVDVVIDWGDGATDHVDGNRDAWADAPLTHTFTAFGIHHVTVTGTFERLGCVLGATSLHALTSVDEWGETGTTSLFRAFLRTSNPAIVEPPPTVTDMAQMFGDSEFNRPIGNWDTSRVTSMHGMFYASGFNQPIGDWDTSQVTDMSGMFTGSPFDRPISDWDTSRVVDMNGMFAASPFDQDIGGWDTGSVVDMRGMFSGNLVFDQPIGGWDTSEVEFMTDMFFYAQSFNQDLSGWCVARLSEKPEQFDLGTSSWTLPRPRWGSCDGEDLVGPVARFVSVTTTDRMTARGTATDGSGVAKVLCAIQDRETGDWLRRDRTWGAYDRLKAVVKNPGAMDTKWLLVRRLPPGRYTVKLIAYDTAGNVNPKPRPFRLIRVDP